MRIGRVPPGLSWILSFVDQVHGCAAPVAVVGDPGAAQPVSERFSDPRAFKAWNDAMVARFDLDRFHAHPSPFVRYVENTRVRRTFALLAARPEHRVLEVGCGAGHLLARLRAGRRCGLDLSAVLLDKAARRIGRSVTLVQGDAESLPLRSGAWDRVYCSEVLEHVANPPAALAEIARVVRLGGIAVVSVPNEAVINRLKAVVRRSGLYRFVMRTGATDYTMPERMDDEWHLHTFDRAALLAMIPRSLRITRVESIPFAWLPLRYIVRCERAVDVR